MRARPPVEATLPSPLLYCSAWSPELSREAYDDPYELVAEAVQQIW